jgi:hypothetical protein
VVFPILCQSFVSVFYFQLNPCDSKRKGNKRLAEDGKRDIKAAQRLHGDLQVAVKPLLQLAKKLNVESLCFYIRLPWFR